MAHRSSVVQSNTGGCDLDDDETLTAYHEAGHAVIAHALGGKVAWLQLGGEADDWLPERFGDCRIHWGQIDPLCDWQRQREILTVLAGPVAEMVYRGESVHPALYGPWQHDWRRAWAASESFLPQPQRRRQFLERLLNQLARQMQHQPCWAAIAAIADELMAHETLEEEQISEILGFWFRRS
jgi:hypothetical protein